MTREERIHSKIAALEQLLSQPCTPSDQAFYQKTLEQFKTNSQQPPRKTSALELNANYNLLNDFIGSMLEEKNNPNTPAEAREAIQNQLEAYQHMLQEMAADFATDFPDQVLQIDTTPERLELWGEFNALCHQEVGLLQIIELQQACLERKPDAMVEKLLLEHTTELEELHKRQTALQTMLNSSTN